MYVPLLAASRGATFFRSPLWTILLVLPASGPALAAWIATPEDTGGWSRLRTSFLRHVAWAWWPTAIFVPLAMSLCANTISLWLAPEHSPDAAPAPPLGVLITIVMSICANPWEEVGWRGFALPRLQARYYGWRAALLIGLMSTLWHIPLFLWSASPMSKIPFLAWAPGVVGESLVLAWLFNRTGRSLAIVSLFHIAFNICGALFGVRSHMVISAVEIGLGLMLAVSAGPRLGLAQDRENTEAQASTSP